MKESKNEFRITGILKSKELHEGQTKSGRDAIMGNLSVQVTVGNQVNVHRIEFFTFKTKKDGSENKIYDSYKTVMDEYKDQDTYGADADVVSVNGSVEYNVYSGQYGTNENMRFRALFANRVAKDAPQVALANLDVIIDGFEAEMKNDQPTGYYKVKGYGVGYNDRGIKFTNLVVDEKLGAHNAVTPGTTILATVKLNNYEVVKQQQEDSDSLFGMTKSVVEKKSYTNNMEMTGGNMSETQYTPDDLNKIKNSVKQQISEAQANTGSFGNAVASSPAPDISDKLPF